MRNVPGALSAPGGYTLRTASLPRDGEAMAGLVSAYFAGYAGRMVDLPENVVAEIAAHDPGRRGGGTSTTTLAFGPGGDLAGFVWLEIADRPDAAPWVDVYAHPAHAGALESLLVEHALLAIDRWVVATDRRDARVESGTLRENVTLGQVLQGHGFVHERTFWDMSRDLGDDVLIVPAAPPGVVVRAVPDDVSGRMLLYRIIDTAFQDHWNHRAYSFEEFWQRKARHPGMDPSQWWVADVDGEPVGALIGDASRAKQSTGYVQSLGVLREGRGRGAARQLLLTAFAEHRARGWTATQLGVDAQSPTGATRLYGSVAMVAIQTFDVYQRPVVTRLGSPT